jgi:hypothetical protein
MASAAEDMAVTGRTTTKYKPTFSSASTARVKPIDQSISFRNASAATARDSDMGIETIRDPITSSTFHPKPLFDP